MEPSFAEAIFGSAGGTPLLSVLIGVLYFALSDARAGFSRRALTSAYAPTTALLYCLAVLVLRKYRYDMDAAAVYMLAQVFVPLVLLFVSFAWYPGRKWHHWYLAPLALLCWTVQFMVGLILVIPAK
jgi:hypothetical protein